MTRRPITWAYLGNKAGPASELAQDALDNPEQSFMFADDDDKTRVRRQIEAVLRTTATDRQLLEIAALLNVRL